MRATGDDEMRLDGRSRVLRGATTAAWSTAVALGAHLLAGGSMPHALGVLVPVLLATGPSALLAGARRLPWLRLGLSVAVSQLFFHLLFALGTQPASPSAAGATALADQAGHGGHAAAVTTAADMAGMVGMVGMADAAGAHTGHTSAAMGAWHACAAVLTMLGLRYGEVTVGRLRDALGRVAVRLVPAVHHSVVPPRPTTTTPADHGVRTLPRRRVATTTTVRRGPPLRTARRPA